MPSCIRALHKQFFLAAAYAKGKGKTFRIWMSKNYPNELLWHAKSVNGSRQDICVDASACIFWNRKYHIKFLATSLCCSDKDNSLEDSLFVMLTSAEFIAVTRSMCMLMVAVSQPMRYLTGCTHTFASYDWNNRHMSKQCDVLEEHLLCLVDHPSNFLDRDFMLNIFGEAREQLPPFDKCLSHMHEEKQQRCIKGIDPNLACAKVIPYKSLIDEIFDPKDNSNIKANHHMSDIIPKVIIAFLKESHDPKKATSMHLSSQDGELSWINATEEDMQHGMGVHVVNDQCESSFGVLTDELKTYENLGLTHAGGMALCEKNGDFASGFRKIGKDGKFIAIDSNHINILLRISTERDYSCIRPPSLKMHACCSNQMQSDHDC